jgi:hypothetical protein
MRSRAVIWLRRENQMAEASFESVSKSSKQRGEGAEARSQRVTLEFSPEAFERLAEIRKLAGADTNADVFRKALRVLEWVLEQQKCGVRLQVERDGAVKEIDLLL